MEPIFFFVSTGHYSQATRNQCIIKVLIVYNNYFAYISVIDYLNAVKIVFQQFRFGDIGLNRDNFLNWLKSLSWYFSFLWLWLTYNYWLTCGLLLILMICLRKSLFLWIWFFVKQRDNIFIFMLLNIFCSNR